MKKELGESVLVETQPDLVGIVALSKGREAVSPWANQGWLGFWAPKRTFWAGAQNEDRKSPADVYPVKTAFRHRDKAGGGKHCRGGIGLLLPWSYGHPEVGMRVPVHPAEDEPSLATDARQNPGDDTVISLSANPVRCVDVEGGPHGVVHGGAVVDNED